jgi:ATP-dependent Clp protease ATP-binding subunit ClpA
MLERFEPAARQALADARDEARRAGQDRICTEHLLLGLLGEPSAAADALGAAGLTADELRPRMPRGGHADQGNALDADALASLGIDLDTVRRATDAAFGRGALDRVRVPGRRRLPMADDTKQTLVGAVRQAHKHGQREITSGHLLIGILDQPRNGALALMAQTGTDVPALRADVLRRMGAAAG